ncbi:MAG: helix-turn-helix domain containing protein [Prevotella sp.]|nr:helix-turn-helix domain containing protein [Prevotella sp.]
MAYSPTDKIKAVRWYRDNGRNQQKTANKFKISTETLRKWLKAHPEILSGETSKNAIAMIEHGRAGNILQFEELQIKKAEIACTMAYERLIELIPQEKSIGNLVTIIEKLNPNKLAGNSEEGEDRTPLATKLDEILAAHNKKWNDARHIIDVEGTVVEDE